MTAAFVSVADAAAFLGLPASTVYDLVSKGRFPVSTVRMGKRILVNRAELEALANADRTSAGQASQRVSVVGSAGDSERGAA